MTIHTFGLPDPGAPDLVGMRAQLDRNDEALMDLAQSIVNGIRERINKNAVILGRTESRIRASINGHIRKNVGLLKPIVRRITEDIANAVDNVQVHVNSLAYRPDVQQWLKAFPPVPAWDGIIPRVPLTEEVKAALDPPGQPSPGGPAAPPLPIGMPAQPVSPPAPPGCHWYQYPPGKSGPPKLICGPPPAAPPAGQTYWWFAFDCQTAEVIGVPNCSPLDQEILVGEGYCPFPGPYQWDLVPDRANIQGQLAIYASWAVTLCAQQGSTCANPVESMP